MTACVWVTKTGQCVQSTRGTLVYQLQNDSPATVVNNSIHVAKVIENRIEIHNLTTGTCLQMLSVDNGENGPTVFLDEESDPEWYLRHPPYGIESHLTWVQYSASGHELLTNLGIIDLSTVANSKGVPLQPLISQSPTSRSEGYSWTREDASWILKDGKRFLWLPTEYRPDIAKAYGSTLAMGFKSGRVVIMRFS